MSFENIEGKNVPKSVFKKFENGTLTEYGYDDIFKGKKVVIFALPGAYTPTCSSTHLPRYNELSSAIKKEGVDAIYVLSVNDAFVMDAWMRDQDAEGIEGTGRRGGRQCHRRPDRRLDRPGRGAHLVPRLHSRLI